MKYFYFLLLSIIPAVSFAQTNFQEGYVINLNQDTVHGLINYQEWSRNPKKIIFKVSKSDNKTTDYRPAEIRGFTIVGYDSYISYAGSLSLASTDIQNLPTGSDSSSKVDTVFFKLIASGKDLSLYEYRDNIKTRYFIQERNAAPTELKYQVYYIDSTPNHYATIEGYKNQLAILAGKYAIGNEKIVRKITNANYTGTDLKQIVNLLNNKSSVNHEKSGEYIRYFAGIGINNTKTQFKGSNIFTGTKPSNSTSPLISAGVDFFVNPHVQRLVIRGEFFFSWDNPQFNVPSTLGEYQYATSWKQYDFTFLPQAIYNFYNTEKVKTYLGLGLGMNYASYSNNQYKLLSATSTQQVSNVYNFNTFWVNIPIEAGIVFNKRIEIMVRYAFPAPITNYVAFTINNSEYQAGLRLFLGKRH